MPAVSAVRRGRCTAGAVRTRVPPAPGVPAVVTGTTTLRCVPGSRPRRLLSVALLAAVAGAAVVAPALPAAAVPGPTPSERAATTVPAPPGPAPQAPPTAPPQAPPSTAPPDAGLGERVDESEQATRRLNMVVIALVALAVVIAAVTVVFWRVTRPRRDPAEAWSWLPADAGPTGAEESVSVGVDAAGVDAAGSSTAWATAPAEPPAAPAAPPASAPAPASGPEPAPAPAPAPAHAPAAAPGGGLWASQGWGSPSPAERGDE